MKVVKWLAVFVIAFLLAWVLIFTFIQTPFKQTASARILTWWTPAIPIYLYVAGSFFIGFVAGLCIAFYNYITLQAKLHRKTKECSSLQEQLSEISQLAGSSVSSGLSKPTGSSEPMDSADPPDPPETSAFINDASPHAKAIEDASERNDAKKLGDHL
jgi:hypothetical protein